MDFDSLANAMKIVADVISFLASAMGGVNKVLALFPKVIGYVQQAINWIMGLFGGDGFSLGGLLGGDGDGGSLLSGGLSSITGLLGGLIGK